MRRRTGPRAGADRQAGGFTLLELLVVIAIISILTTLVVVQLTKTPIKAKEAVLKEDLFTLRDVIDQYFSDKGKYPDSLQALVEDGYLRKVPVDPFTNTSESWQVETAPMDQDTEGTGGVYDVHSGAGGTALDGTNYSEW